MNIGIFTDTFTPQINGVVTSTESFKSAFEEMGHEVTVFCPKIKGHTDTDPHIWRFNSVPYPFQKEYRLVVPYSMKLSEFKSLNLDVIHAQTPFSMGYLAWYLSKKHKIGFVHTYHTFFAEYIHYVPVLPKKLMKWWAQWESRRFCEGCHHIVVPSEQMVTPLREYGVKTPISVVPTGVKPMKVTQAETDAFCARFDIRATDRCVVFVGRLGMEKNVFFLMEAFQRVKASVPEAKLLVVGDGPLRTNMKKWVKEASLSDSVVFTGYLSKKEVFASYQRSEVLMFPSKTETQGMSIVEALSMGTPAVCVNKMGVKYVLEGNRGGILVEEDVNKYAESVVSLLKDPKLYAQKQAEAFERAKAFSIDTLAKEMIGIYETVHYSTRI